MNEDKIMSAEAFNELIDGFEIVGSLTEYGRKNVKYHVKKLQEENQQLKEQLEASEKARKKSIELLSIIYSISVNYDGFNDVSGLKAVIDDMARYIKKTKVILDIDKGE